MRIAVIGAGLGGLVAAWLLGRAGRAVTLFERAARPGFTAANVAVPGRGAAGNAVRVDVPLRVFYPGYYPTLTRLYAELGVPSEPVSYATSFHGPAWAGRDAAALYFRYRNLRWGGRSVAMPGPADLVGAWAPGAPAWGIAAAALRFRRLALPALARGELAGITIGEWASAQRLPRSFIDGLLLPAIATVCTCTLAQAGAVPAVVAVDYMASGVLRQSVHRALHGADDVQRRLLPGIADLRCGAAIAAVRRLPGGVDGAGVDLRMADGSTDRFDHVVLATQAAASLRLLADADAAEAAALAGLPDTPVQVLTHSDARLMPARRRDWSPVNLWVDAAGGAVESTIWVNAVQPVLLGAPDVFQTVGPLRPVDVARVLGEARFQRPVVTLDSERALTALQALQARPGRCVWFCGSQAQPGVPLLESAVRSAYAVAERLGALAPGDALASPAAALPGQVAASSA